MSDIEESDDGIFLTGGRVHNIKDLKVLGNILSRVAQREEVCDIQGDYDQALAGTCWIHAGLCVLQVALCQLPTYTGPKNFMVTNILMGAKLDYIPCALKWLCKNRRLPSNDTKGAEVAMVLDSTCQDGGHWQQFIHLVKKYGLVAKPDNVEHQHIIEGGNSFNTSGLNSMLGDVVRKAYVDMKQCSSDSAASAICNRAEDECRTMIIKHLKMPGYNQNEAVALGAHVLQSIDGEAIVPVCCDDRDNSPTPHILRLGYLPPSLDSDPICMVGLDRQTFNKVVTRCAELKFPMFTCAGWDSISSRELGGVVSSNVYNGPPMDSKTALMGNLPVNHAVTLIDYIDSVYIIQNSHGTDANHQGKLYLEATDPSEVLQFVHVAAVPFRILNATLEDEKLKTLTSAKLLQNTHLRERPIPMLDPIGAAAWCTLQEDKDGKQSNSNAPGCIEYKYVCVALLILLIVVFTIKEPSLLELD